MPASRRLTGGKTISPGIVIGTTRIVVPGETAVAEMPIAAADVRKEIAVLENAIEDTIAEVRELRESAGRKIGGPVAKIFDAQLLIAADNEFLKQVKEQIAAQRRNAGYIYNQLVQQTTLPLKKSPDTYLRQMALDIEAVAHRVLSHLSGFGKSSIKVAPNTILVGKQFTPGDILKFREDKVIGFVISQGGADSHAALIARALLLPLIQIPAAWIEIPNGARVILDGTSGDVIINPTDTETAHFQKLRRRMGPAAVRRIKKLPSIPPKTADGKAVEIAANLTLPGPADDILAERNIPVGLFRTEFLYLAQNRFPDEEAQYEHYKSIAERFAPADVVIRVFDLGNDKLSPMETATREENPALGHRGMRALLDLGGELRTQLRAILRASVHGNVRLLLPMVTDMGELDKTRRILAQVKVKLRRDGIPFDENIKLGLMVEVPSVALLADEFAAKVDFFSIGSNDLTQYTLAADRGNARLQDLYSAFHPSVLRLIDRTVRAARARGIPVSLCGEAAGDILGLPIFIGMGITQLSMSPQRIFDVCRSIARIDTNLLPALTRVVLNSRSLEVSLRNLRDFRRAVEKR